MMSAFDYDLFVIGAGSGGVRAARMSAQLGARVAIAEEDRVGGTCVIRGCVPKKFFVYASEYGHAFDEARGYGWTADNIKFDWKTLLRNKNDEIDRLNGIYIRNLENAGATLIQSRAVIEDPHTIRLLNENKTVTADKILIATGGRPRVDKNCDGFELGIISDHAFHLETLPRHVVIAGGGYIAIEFACIFNGLGCEVCIVNRKEDILRAFDTDISVRVHQELKRKGVRVITNNTFDRIEDLGGDNRRVHLSGGDEIEPNLVFWAIGRDPHTKDLGLEGAGVELTDSGAIKVDAFSQTTQRNIYAVGDVTNRENLTPVAIREGAAFARTVFGDAPTQMDYAYIPKAVFAQPPVGTVGYAEREARQLFDEINIYKADFRAMKHMLTGSEERVLMKLVVDAKNDRVVGCHMVGEDAPEIMQTLAIAIKHGVTKKQFDETCALHPSVAEEFVTMRTKWTPPEL